VTPIEQFLWHLDNDEPERAIGLALGQVRDGRTVTEVVQGLLGPAQQEVGVRWHAGRYTVAQEHAVSAVIDDLLGLLTIHTAPPTDEHRLVIACAEGEWHTTPARMAALCFRDAGWRVRFLGGSMPADHLERSLGDLAPSVVAVSCTLPIALGGVRTLADAAHRQGVPVLAGGAALGTQPGRAERLGADGHHADPVAAADLLRGWLDLPPAPGDPTGDPDADDERAVLVGRRAEILDDTYAELERTLPVMALYDDRQRDHTRQDLAYILQFLDAALLVGDASLFEDFIGWLGGLLAARGVPPAALDRSLEALGASIGRDLPRAQRLLAAGQQLLAS
jgi:methanogenic corrinoid protein MtbC1